MNDIRQVMAAAASSFNSNQRIPDDQPIKVAVDLGTAFIVVVVTDEAGMPLISASRFADVVRDGIVWDFASAVDIVRELKEEIEERCGRELTMATVTIPPDVNGSDHRAHKYVLENAGIECVGLVDEPTAANNVLRADEAAVVDVGGGTTGVGIVRNSQVVTTVDEPGGGTQMSLVIAGAKKIPFDEAEMIKRDRSQHKMLMPIVRPVIEKIATIVSGALEKHGAVNEIILVGGTCEFDGIDRVVESIIGIPTRVPPEPMLITPLGAAQDAKAFTSSQEV